MFLDGNVNIIVNPNVFSLHSSILAQKSKKLSRLCGDTPPDCATYLTLVTAEDPAVTLLEVQVGPDLYNRAKEACTRETEREPSGILTALIRMQDIETFTNELETIAMKEGQFTLEWPERLQKCWTNFLKSFYGIDPNFTTQDPQSFTQEVRDTLRIAEDMEISFSDGMKGIERSLLCLDQILFHAIAMYPASWASLGKRMRSAAIYQESLIHIVGRWNSLSSTAIASLEPYTRDLCKVKHQELVLRKRTIEYRILSYYPESLHRGADGELGCIAYATDVYMWMALALYRQWLCYALIERRNLHALDGGSHFYRSISLPGSYLNARDQSFFNIVFPMSRRGCDMLNAKLHELKMEMQSFVVPLLINRCRYVFAQDPPYLTCCQIDKEDLPWDERFIDAVDQDVRPENESQTPEVVHMQDIVLHNGSDSTSQTASNETPDASTTAPAQSQSIAQMHANNTGAHNNGNGPFTNVYNNNYTFVARREDMMENLTNPYYARPHTHNRAHSTG